MENKDNRNLEEEMDTASEAKAGEETAQGASGAADADPAMDAENGENPAGECEACSSEEADGWEESFPEDDSAQDDGPAAEKEGFFKKKKKDKKEDAFKAKIDELEDRVKRQMAEFENFRKRTDKEKSAMFETGAKSVIEKILPVVDNFERGLAAVPEDEKGSAFGEGMNKVYKQLMTELDNMGVKPIEAAGQEFDPNYHNAVMHVEDEAFGENIVAEEFQKGYTYHDAVVRHSMVKVAN